MRGELSDDEVPPTVAARYAARAAEQSISEAFSMAGATSPTQSDLILSSQADHAEFAAKNVVIGFGKFKLETLQNCTMSNDTMSTGSSEHRFIRSRIASTFALDLCCFITT